MSFKFICKSRQVSEYFWQYSVYIVVIMSVLLQLNTDASCGDVWWVANEWYLRSYFSNDSLYLCVCVRMCVWTQSIETLFSLQFYSYQYYYLICTCTSTHPRDRRTYSSPGSRCHFHCRHSLACWSWHGEPWSAVVSVCQAWWCQRLPLGCSADWLDPPSPLQGNICTKWDNKDLNQLMLPCCSHGMVVIDNMFVAHLFLKIFNENVQTWSIYSDWGNLMEHLYSVWVFKLIIVDYSIEY